MYKFAEEYVNKNIIKVLRKINIKKGRILNFRKTG